MLGCLLIGGFPGTAPLIFQFLRAIASDAYNSLRIMVCTPHQFRAACMVHMAMGGEGIMLCVRFVHEVSLCIHVV